MYKKRLAVLFGGKSEEHTVSIMSCSAVLNHLKSDLYVVHVIGITKQGQWRYIELGQDRSFEALNHGLETGRNMAFDELGRFLSEQVDVVFPVLHGPFGEDGTLQGFLEIIGAPYVGADVPSSVMCMDKVYMKRVLLHDGIPMAPFEVVYRDEALDTAATRVMKTLKFPLFIKPANLGSSVGIHKAKTQGELMEAMEQAFQYDKKIIIEQGVNCRELECGILGNPPYRVSTVGEIVASHEFYDYDAKYFDDGQSKMIIPAVLSETHQKTIQEASAKVCRLLGVEGMARVDFFLDLETDQILFNEINTIPGFTQYSMYPGLFGHDGLSYTDLIDALIEFAFARRTR